jgi:hypothetical protein
MNANMEKAVNLQKQIAKLSKQQASTLAELGESLSIQAIWPDAFKHGKVAFCQRAQIQSRGDKTPQHIMLAWFRADNGEVHNLTRKELERFKPDILIHKDYMNVH